MTTTAPAKPRAYTPAKTSGFMTAKNHSYYLILWGKVRAKFPKADRKALHVKALGYQASSKSFTAGEWRKVRDLFMRMAGLKPPTKEDEEEAQYLFALRRYAAAIDADDAYLAGIWTNMGRVGGLRSWDDLDELPVADLEKILIAVMKDARRRWKSRDERWPEQNSLWEALFREWQNQELENDACEEIVRKVLKCGAVFPPPHKWSYEDMLAVLGETKRRAKKAF